MEHQKLTELLEPRIQVKIAEIYFLFWENPVGNDFGHHGMFVHG